MKLDAIKGIARSISAEALELLLDPSQIMTVMEKFGNIEQDVRYALNTLKAPPELFNMFEEIIEVATELQSMTTRTNSLNIFKQLSTLTNRQQQLNQRVTSWYSQNREFTKTLNEYIKQHNDATHASYHNLSDN